MPVCNSRYAKLAGENRIIRRKFVLQRSLKEFIGEKYEKYGIKQGHQDLNL
jgi:hypothetical protein